jgi:hypothetical protein
MDKHLKFSVAELFTKKEIKEAIYLCQLSQYPIESLEKFLEPIMPRINEVTGQENHTKYFAYLLQHLATNCVHSRIINGDS